MSSLSIGDDKQFEAPEQTLSGDRGPRQGGKSRRGVSEITAGFIDTDCSNTSKSAQINFPSVAGAARQHDSSVAIFA